MKKNNDQIVRGRVASRMFCWCWPIYFAGQLKIMRSREAPRFKKLTDKFCGSSFVSSPKYSYRRVVVRSLPAGSLYQVEHTSKI
jgi:hypothetical protein